MISSIHGRKPRYIFYEARLLLRHECSCVAMEVSLLCNRARKNGGNYANSMEHCSFIGWFCWAD